nr:DUF4349 domain-containing protein [uncultured Chryseobacterium sp.]
MKKIILSLFCLILFNCNKAENQHEIKADLMKVIEEDKSSEASMDMVTPSSPKEENSGKPVSAISGNSETTGKSEKTGVISKKIIKNGELNIQVGEIKKAQQQVNEMIRKNKAYIQSEQLMNTDSDENLILTIRVPHQNFDELIHSFSEGIGSVLSKNISSDDVTEEYSDVSIKLENKKIYLEKYRNMLRSAKTTKDMLEIQENIRDLEDEIDVAEGRLRFIDDRVNYSTLNLTLHKEKIRSSATSQIGFGSRFGDSLTEGWNSFVSFILGVISLWPFVLLIPVIIIFLKKWKGSRNKK